MGSNGPRQLADLLLQLGDPTDDVSWKLDGRCAETDPAAFFVDKGGNPEPAFAICATCEVRLRCLEYAIQTEQALGIWGGTTANDRRTMRAMRRDASHEPTPAGGRRPISPERQAAVIELLDAGVEMKDIAAQTGVSYWTIRRLRARHLARRPSAA